MAIRYEETNNFEIHSPARGVYDVGFKCPQCQESLFIEEVSPTEGSIEGDCPNCNSSIYAQLKLVLEWE